MKSKKADELKFRVIQITRNAYDPAMVCLVNLRTNEIGGHLPSMSDKLVESFKGLALFKKLSIVVVARKNEWTPWGKRVIARYTGIWG